MPQVPDKALKKSQGRIVPPLPVYLFLPALAVVFFILYYAILFVFANPAAIEKSIVSNLKAMTRGEIAYENFRLIHFPTLTAEFDQMKISAQDPFVFNSQAKKMAFHFSFLGFLFGKAEISEAYVFNGEFHTPMSVKPPFEQVDLQNLKVQIRARQSLKKLLINWEGDFEGAPQSVRGKLMASVEHVSKWKWETTMLTGDVFLQNFPVKTLQELLGRQAPLVLQEGTIEGPFHFEKANHDSWIHATGTPTISKLVYQTKNQLRTVSSPPADAAIDFELKIHPFENEFNLTRGLIESPFGKLNLYGQFSGSTQEIKDARIAFEELLLESIPQYIPAFKEAVPFNLGFSGKSNLEMSAEGKLNHLSLHANWDFTSSLLAYAGYFSKPKDLPLNLIFDLLLKEGKSLSGDFSIKLEEAGIKGAVAHLDLVSGEGQINILTNKFSLARWKNLLPPFADYQLEGDIKILANVEGNLLQRPNETKGMMNLTLEKGMLSKEDLVLRNIYLTLDYSPISLEIKQAQIQAGDYPLRMNLILYDPYTQPHAKLNLSSEKLDFGQTVESLRLIEPWLPEGPKNQIEKIREFSGRWLPPGQSMDHFSAQLETKESEWKLLKLEADVYKGKLHIAGEGNWSAESPKHHFDVEIQRLSLAKYFTRFKADEDSPLEGNFFLKAAFDGTVFTSDFFHENTMGKGSFALTNGQFNSFSLLKTISGLQDLSMLSVQAPPYTSFDDFRSDFTLKEGKWNIEKGLLLSRDYHAKVYGDISLKGILNFRVDTFLTSSVVQEFLEPFLGSNAVNQNELLGPIPLLLSGELKHPELKTDPSQIAEFTENFAKKKVQKVLRNFLPEETLFKRLKSS